MLAAVGINALYSLKKRGRRTICHSETMAFARATKRAKPDLDSGFFSVDFYFIQVTDFENKGAERNQGSHKNQK